jgi:transcriptional regulator with XRE-family HTH domain
MFLKKWRSKRGIKQADLASAVNITNPLLSYLEQGKALPTRETLYLLEQTLNVSRYDLYTDFELSLHDKKKRPRKDYSSYHVHIKLDKKFKKVLNSKTFKKLGYKNMNDWFHSVLKKLIFRMEIVENYEFFKTFYENREKEKATSLRHDVTLIAASPEQRKTAPLIIQETDRKDNTQ